MANRYWVGGSGTWDTTSTANWSATSGGAGGASAPTAADAVFFNSSSGGGTCTIGENVSCLTMRYDTYTGTFAFGTNKISVTGNAATVMLGGTGYSVSGTPRVELTYSGSTGTRTVSTSSVSEANALDIYVVAGTDTVLTGSSQHVGTLDFTGFSGTFTSATRTVYRSYILSSTMTVSAFGGLTFVGTSGSHTIDFGGITFDGPVTINGAGGSWTLARDTALVSTRALTLTNGTLNAGNKNVTVGTFALGSGTKTLTMGSGTWTVLGASWNANTNSTGLTLNANTSTITMTSASAKTFSGGGFTWNILNQGGAGALTIAQSNTFANITNTVQPATITLTAGTTQTVSAFGVSGTAGNLITLNSSSAGVQATLSDASGTVNVSYVSIKDIAATGGAGWDAYTSNGNVDAGNNSGWVFDPAPSDVSVEFFMNLRSFTEPRRF